MTQSLPHSIQSSWEKVRERLARELPPRAFDLWLSNSSLMDLVRGTLRIGLPSEMMREWVQDNYAELITQLASEEMGLKVRVEFTVDDALFARLGADGRRIALAVQTLGTKPRGARRFEDFVQTTGNARALQALKHLIAGRLPKIDPLVITGESGAGKSHLAEALAEALGERIETVLLRGQEFADRLAHGWKARRNDIVREELLRYEAIVFDDLEALAGKVATQRELVLILEDLNARGGHFVAFARENPSAINGLSDSLTSHLEAGLIVGMDPPDPAETVQVLASVQQSLGRQVPIAALEALVAAVDGGFAERARATNRMVAHARLSDEVLDAAFVKKHLAEFAEREDPSARRIQVIFSLVEEYFGVQREDLISKRKTQVFSAPRGLIVLLLRQHVGMTFKEIGLLLGQRSHTSIFLMHKKFEEQIQERKDYAALIKEVGRRILVAS